MATPLLVRNVDRALAKSFAACRLASTATMVLKGTQTVDGIQSAVGDRVLVKNQTDARENGIYVVAPGAWARAVDFNQSSDLATGSVVGVTEGALNANTLYQLVFGGEGSVGSTSFTFEQQSFDINNAGFQAIVDDLNANPSDLGTTSAFLNAGDPTTTSLLVRETDGSYTNQAVTAFIRSLLDDEDASTALTTLGFSDFVKTLIDDANASADYYYLVNNFL